MISTDDFISEAVSLPVDIRLKLVERLLESLNPLLMQTLMSSGQSRRRGESPK